MFYSGTKGNTLGINRAVPIERWLLIRCNLNTLLLTWLVRVCWEGSSMDPRKPRKKSPLDIPMLRNLIVGIDIQIRNFMKIHIFFCTSSTNGGEITTFSTYTCDSRK